MHENIKEEMMIELLKEELISISELTFFTSPAVKKIINDVPVVHKQEFIDNMRKGDIIVAFTAKKQILRVNKKSLLFISKIMASFQGSPYTSSKLVIDDKHVAGYGIKIIDKPEENKIYKLTYDEFVNDREEMMLIRLKDASKNQIDKACNFVRERVGLDYQSSDLLKTMWNRFTGRKLFPFLKDKTLQPEEISMIQEPLFCSNMISLAYRAAGYNNLFNNKNPWDVWPRDFIVDDRTEKIVRVDPFVS